ncbi:MAG: hypothetical protein NTW60_00025 [Candidatus Wolfebacteria bacterium]|nr:hypothetical protein [Candidatus Wolfebacteria bacterium]
MKGRRAMGIVIALLYALPVMAVIGVTVLVWRSRSLKYFFDDEKGG